MFAAKQSRPALKWPGWRPRVARCGRDVWRDLGERLRWSCVYLINGSRRCRLLPACFHGSARPPVSVATCCPGLSAQTTTKNVGSTPFMQGPQTFASALGHGVPRPIRCRKAMKSRWYRGLVGPCKRFGWRACVRAQGRTIFLQHRDHNIERDPCFGTNVLVLVVVAA